jgi:DNA modification methylase
LNLTGFDAKEITALQIRVGTGWTDEDAVPEKASEPVSKLGDTWRMGPHKLACADATSAADVARLLNAVEPQLMVTDPPYGVDYQPKWRNIAFGEANRSTGTVVNDHRADWRAAWKLFPGSVVYVWHAGTKAAIVADSLEASDFLVRAQIIWNKPHFVISRGHYHVQHEPCWYAVRKGAAGQWQGSRKQTTVWDIGNGLSQCGPRQPENVLTGHGTQKPVECMRRPILNHTKAGETVYDPFVGSGTTIIAAETTGRVALAIDVDPGYVDVAIRRWQNFTGRKAMLEGTELTFDQLAQK